MDRLLNKMFITVAMKELQLQGIVWLNLTIIMLSERRHNKKAYFYYSRYVEFKNRKAI